MAVLFDGTVSGNGNVSFGSVEHLLYMLWSIRVGSPDFRYPEPDELDHPLRAGWLSIFYRGSDLVDLGEQNYYDAPIFLNFWNGRWAPQPQSLPGGSGFDFAAGVRYHLAVPAEMRLQIVSV